MRWIGATAIALMLTLPACSRDKVLDGRKLTATEPAKAVELLRQAAAERSPCYECQAYLGLALEKTGDLAGAAAAYEAALATPDAAGRSEPVPQRLLDVYEKLFQSARGDDKLAIARKAAALESSLKVGRPWANQYLASEWRKGIAPAAKAGKVAEARKLADAIEALYLSLETKREVAIEATEALKAAFVATATQAFRDKVAADLAEAGRYEPEGTLVRLQNRFTVPSPTEDEAFDPEADGFKVALRKAACTPLRAQLGDVVGKVVPAIGLKPVTDADVDALFARLFERAKAGFTTAGGDRKPPAGQTWLCLVEAPLPEFLGELYRFSE
jgi:tetratricopeptide (TPR) repeat protein